MNRLLDVVRTVSATVTPTKADEENLARVARIALSRTLESARKYPEVKEVVLGGSYAKGTWIPGNADVDIFVRLKPSTPERKFEEVGLAIGSAAMRGFPRGKKYAQHPYTEATVSGVKVNIVPCYAVTDRKWMSAADRSPFHVDLVKAIPESQKLEVRLLKVFMRAAGVYGAEIETQGFSGYVAEVLIMRDKTFLEVLRGFASYTRTREDRLFTLPDPVDPSRDLGIAVSGEKMGKFILACRAFLRHPEEAGFRQMKGQQHEALSGRVVALVFRHKDLSEDILWGELRRTINRVVRHLEVRGFKMARYLAASDNRRNSALLFIPEFEVLPQMEQRVGPSVDLKDETEAFISRNRRKAKLVWVDGDARVRLLQIRESTSLSAFLEETARGKAGSTGASHELAAGMKKSARVLTGGRLLELMRREKWLSKGVAEIVSDSFGTSSS